MDELPCYRVTVNIVSGHCIFVRRMANAVLLIFSLPGLIFGQYSNMTRQEMMKYLTDASRYNSDIIPDYNKEEPAIVRIQMTIHDLHTISETSMDFSLDMFLRQVWRDERLDFSFYNTSYSKLEVDPKNIDTVWHPDTYFRNERKASVHSVTKRNELMHISRNGTIVYSMRLSMTLTCAMLLHKYPFDKQLCPIYIQSFGYTVENIDLEWRDDKPLSVNLIELPHFSLDQTVTTRRLILKHQTGTFSCLKAEINLHRKAAYYFIHVFMPSILLVVLSWVSFWVDPNAVPARVTLGVTCVLTLTTQSSGIRQSLPPVSYIKAIDVWMFVCLLFVFAALLEFAYINVVQRRSQNIRSSKKNDDLEENSNQDTKTEDTCLSKLMCLKDPSEMSAHDRAKRVDIIARIAFPVVFAIYLVIFTLVCGFAPDPTVNTLVTGA